MAEATTIIEPTSDRAEESSSSAADSTSAVTISVNKTASTTPVDDMSIETALDSKVETSFQSPSNVCESTVATIDTPPPRALQNLVLAAASDLMDVSPRSMLMETPTSQVGTPYAERKSIQDESTPSATPETNEDKKPKSILRKPKYTATVPIVLDSDLSPTTGNTIHNMNQCRKNRSEFEFDFSEIDRLVDKDDDFYDVENSGNTTLLSMLWSIVVLPIVLLGYGGLPYIVFGCTVWMLIFVARWVRRFVVEEFSMRRNGLDKNGKPIPPSVERPFSSPAGCSMTNLSGILASLSPRAKTIRFEKGIKFPERKLLRQPIPRIQKPKANDTIGRSNLKKSSSLFFNTEEESNLEGDTWSLDSLMVLRNYMKDDTVDNNSSNALEPTPISVMAPPPPYPPTLSAEEEAALRTDKDTSIRVKMDDDTSGTDEADEEGNGSVDEAELLSGYQHRHDSLSPQEVVEEEDTAYESRHDHAVIELDDDDDDEIMDDYFHEGLFGKSDSESNDGSSRNSRYRRRKPRDSLCFSFTKATFVPEGPSIPKCPSDEQEILNQKIQEKFEQANVFESSTAAVSDTQVESAEDDLAEDNAPQVLSSEIITPNDTCQHIEADIEAEDIASSDHEVIEEDEEDADVTTSSLTTGSWDDQDGCQPSGLLPPLVTIIDENYCENDVDASSNDVDNIENECDDVSSPIEIDPDEHLSDDDDLPDLADEVKAALRETEALLASFVHSNNILSHLSPAADEEDMSVSSNVSTSDTSLKEELEAADLSNCNVETTQLIEQDDSFEKDAEQSPDDIISLPTFEEETPLAIDNDDVMPLTESDEPVSNEEGDLKMTDKLHIVNDLEILMDDDDEASEPTKIDLVASDKQVIAKSDSLTEQTEPEEASLGTEPEDLPLNQEASVASHSDTTESSDSPEPSAMNDDDTRSTYYAEEDLVMDEQHFSTIIDEAMQKGEPKELSILQDDMSPNDDDFPDFNVMQEISFDDGSDDVECILSPHAFNFEDEDTSFRDRDPLAYGSFAKNETPSKGPILHEVHTTSSDLHIEMSVSDVDVECTLSPLYSCDQDSNSFGSDSDSEAEISAPPSPKSTRNKENSHRKPPLGMIEKGKFFVDTTAPTKSLEDTNLPWSPAFPRTVLSPSNQRSTPRG